LQLLILLQTAFTIWMLVDVAQRRAETYGWAIILFVPFGSYLYFFLVKAKDPSLRRRWRTLFQRPVSLERLRYEAQTTPSIANQVRLAQGLHDHGDHGEAATLFRAVLAQSPDDKAALFGLGACRVQQRAFAEALAPLERVVDLDLAYRDYLAAMELCGALWHASRKEDSLEVLRRVARHSRRLEHELGLARCLVQLERRDEARALLQQALDDHRHSPPYVQRQARRHAREAERLLRGL